jgi:hypothetical protein
MRCAWVGWGWGGGGGRGRATVDQSRMSNTRSTSPPLQASPPPPPLLLLLLLLLLLPPHHYLHCSNRLQAWELRAGKHAGVGRHAPFLGPFLRSRVGSFRALMISEDADGTTSTCCDCKSTPSSQGEGGREAARGA